MIVRELTRRTYRKEVIINGPEDVFRLCRKMAPYKREHFVVILLNARHTVIAVETVSIGTLNASLVHPREMYFPAITQSAAAVICVHNHPSKTVDPSEEDVQLTRRLAQAGHILGIELLDHVIISGKEYLSLKSRGLFEPVATP